MQNNYFSDQTQAIHSVVVHRVVPIPEYIVDYILVCYILIWENYCGASQEPEEHSLLWSWLCTGFIPGMLMGCSWRNWPFSAHEALLLMSICRSLCMFLQIKVWNILIQLQNQCPTLYAVNSEQRRKRLQWLREKCFCASQSSTSQFCSQR